MIEAILARVAGAPIAAVDDDGRPMLRFVRGEATVAELHLAHPDFPAPPPALAAIYGRVRGGFVGDLLKLAMTGGPDVWGVPSLAHHRADPQLEAARRRVPWLTFFLDGAGVTFFGVAESKLWTLDEATDQLEPVGPLADALEETLATYLETDDDV